MIITGYIELFVCSIVPLLSPIEGEEPNLFGLSWSEELSAIDKFCLLYGILVLFVFTLMNVVYIIVILYMAPKMHRTVGHKSLLQLKKRMEVYQRVLKFINENPAEPRVEQLKIKQQYEGGQHSQESECDNPDNRLRISHNREDRSSITSNC